jgi:UDP-N-acetyl-D-glucosamine dehydrogenase
MSKKENFKSEVIIWGLGYVGLEVFYACVNNKIKVTGFDISEKRINFLNQSIRNNVFPITSSLESLKPADLHVICVPTPLDENSLPNIEFIKSTVNQILPKLRPNDTIILESTSFTGTTEEVIGSMLKKAGFKVGQDIFLGFSPERIDPGNSINTFSNTPKIVSGVSKESVKKIHAFYSLICKSVIIANSVKEAETAKLVENTYRLVNIALVNEFSIYCSEIGIDPTHVLDLAATKPFGFTRFNPSVGVGGHCIAVDPEFYLHVFNKLNLPYLSLVRSALDFNRQLAPYFGKEILSLVSSESFRILIIGLTYKPNIDDFRESPGFRVVDYLINNHNKGSIDLYDPFSSKYVEKYPDVYNFISLDKLKMIEDKKERKYDLVFVAQNHDYFNTIDWKNYTSILLYPFKKPIIYS